MILFLDRLLDVVCTYYCAARAQVTCLVHSNVSCSIIHNSHYKVQVVKKIAKKHFKFYIILNIIDNTIEDDC